MLGFWYCSLVLAIGVDKALGKFSTEFSGIGIVERSEIPSDIEPSMVTLIFDYIDN